jgi:hypothetical protein
MIRCFDIVALAEETFGEASKMITHKVKRC